MNSRLRTVLSIAAAFFAAVTTALPQTCKTTGDAAGHFDYYLLSLSWKPEFCAQHARANPDECKNRPDLGFVVHGLWPQNNTGASPELCGVPAPLSPQDSAAVKGLMFGASLVQHEWTCHGSCSNLSPSDYFSLIAKDRNAIQIPAQFTQVPKPITIATKLIESAFESANNAPAGAFRVDCQAGALVEVRACFSKTLGLIQCANALPDCTQKSISVRPTQ
ncbi:MAG: hypothetical protein M3N54_03570 [Acidobacteriota bacterium]|nr:hypothetical protein [Acidobacteriota bacterium]